MVISPVPVPPSPDNEETPPGHIFDVIEPDAAVQTGAPAHPAAQQRTFPVPYVTYSVIAICLIVFVYYNEILGRRALDPLTFSPGQALVWPGILTHMFAHNDEMHILGNMVSLFFMGRIIEWRYGSVRFAAIYFVSGLFAALLQAAFDPFAQLLGASGAIAGIMAVFLRHYPNARLWLMGILPMPTWVLIPGWMVLNILGATVSNNLGIAFLAHLGGFAAGMLMSLVFVHPGQVEKNPWFEVK